jgi:hypothetical protein
MHQKKNCLLVISCDKEDFLSTWPCLHSQGNKNNQGNKGGKRKNKRRLKELLIYTLWLKEKFNLS